MQEEQRRVRLVGELDELRRLLRLLGEQHALRVGEDADRLAVQLRPAGDERGAVERLELVEGPAVVLARAVDDPGDDLARVERLLEVGGDEVEQVLGVGVGLGEEGSVAESPDIRGLAPRIGAEAQLQTGRPGCIPTGRSRFRRATIRRPIRIASCSSSAR